MTASDAAVVISDRSICVADTRIKNTQQDTAQQEEMVDMDIEDLSMDASHVRPARTPFVGRVASSPSDCDNTASTTLPLGHRPATEKIFIKTFGCAHNQSDSEYMAGQLQAYGYRLLPDCMHCS